MIKRALQIIRWILCFAAVCGGSASLLAETVSAKATLSSESVAIGDSVEFRVELPGVGGGVSAPELSLDGVRAVGPQIASRIQIGTSFESATTLIYTLEPERAGTFTIPALRFRAGNRTVETQPVSFKAEENRPAGKGKAGDGLRAWAEIVLPKKEAYLGETLPVEIRMFLDSAIRWQLEEMPSLDGEGFTKAKLSEPRKTVVEREGRKYDEVVLHTSITAIKAGTTRIGPAEFTYQAQIPRARPNQPRSPFSDIFGDDFFNDPLSPFARTEQKKTVAEAAELTVKPLPIQGRPAAFSGAVGAFTLSAEGSPGKVKIGDPITMKLKVGGSGNFDRVAAPELADPTGWRAYPPSSNFKPDDDVGSHGTKTFEIAVIPETKKTQMPVFEFSYFDPVAEKYVTASSGRLPLSVEGEALPAPPPVERVPRGGNAPPASAGPAPEPAVRVNDIHGIAYDFGPARSFEPLYFRRGFWLAQLAPFLLLTGTALARTRKPSLDGGRIGASRRERAAKFASLRGERDRIAFYENAARVLQLQTALRTRQTAEAIDAGTVLQVLEPDPETAATIEAIFQARAEALYAGGGDSRGVVTESDRRRVIEAIERSGGAK